ncbi:11618_t:CDS:2 [Entrophospora sp. SA101]|nr:10181_t:CDS:2 [Entrophospora sp. SA101]CAJ0747602.1 11618_t:CDS:2 [Entrophospora sp. SA101]
MSEELKNHLDSLGWILNDKGLIDLQNILETEQLTHNDIIKELLNKDLRRIGRGAFKDDFSNAKNISGPLVLQLLSIINLSTPLQDQREIPRLLQLTLTDGIKKIKGVEMLGKVENVSLSTPPGTKFMVKNPIKIQENILFLGPGLLENLGGKVEEMIREWQFLKVDGNKKNDGYDGRGRRGGAVGGHRINGNNNRNGAREGQSNNNLHEENAWFSIIIIIKIILI